MGTERRTRRDGKDHRQNTTTRRHKRIIAGSHDHRRELNTVSLDAGGRTADHLHSFWRNSGGILRSHSSWLGTHSGQERNAAAKCAVPTHPHDEKKEFCSEPFGGGVSTGFPLVRDGFMHRDTPLGSAC